MRGVRDANNDNHHGVWWYKRRSFGADDGSDSPVEQQGVTEMSETQKYGDMMQRYLFEPVTQIEVDKALDAIHAAGIDQGPAWVIRRLALQRNILLQEWDMLCDGIDDVIAGKCTIADVQETADLLREKPVAVKQQVTKEVS